MLGPHCKWPRIFPRSRWPRVVVRVNNTNGKIIIIKHWLLTPK